LLKTLTTIGEGAVVTVNGNVIVPERRMGDISEYFWRHVSRYLNRECGMIESITVSVEGVRFFAEIST